jgi:hypothetical protein
VWCMAEGGKDAVRRAAAACRALAAAASNSALALSASTLAGGKENRDTASPALWRALHAATAAGLSLSATCAASQAATKEGAVDNTEADWLDGEVSDEAAAFVKHHLRSWGCPISEVYTATPSITPTHSRALLLAFGWVVATRQLFRLCADVSGVKEGESNRVQEGLEFSQAAVCAGDGAASRAAAVGEAALAKATRSPQVWCHILR